VRAPCSKAGHAAQSSEQHKHQDLDARDGDAGEDRDTLAAADRQNLATEDSELEDGPRHDRRARPIMTVWGMPKLMAE